MAQPLFGTGLATLTPTLSGAQTPIVVAVLEDISLDVSAKIVDLIGNLQVAVDKAKAEVKWAGKFKTGYFAGGLIAAILSGSTIAAGSQQPIFGETFTLAGTSYTTTKGALTIAGTAGDLGVFDTTANKFLTAVASAPAAGQYVPATSAGLLTFAAADTGHVMQVSYLYTASSTGTTITYNNQYMGTNTTFAFRLFNNYQAAAGGANVAAAAGLYLPVVTIPKLSLAFKNAGFMDKNVDFECSANAAGQVAQIYTGN
jgi:hypothetical protein